MNSFFLLENDILLLLQCEALEHNLRAHRETFTKNTQGFKAKLGELNNKISALTEEKRETESRVSTLQQEIAALQASKSETAPPAAVQTEETQKQNALIVRTLSFIP